MPSAPAIARSSGAVMKPRIKSALAPTYTVDTVTDAFSLRGYCLTFSVRIACTPAMRIRRLTTSASTGRRMNRSVIDRTAPPLGVRRTGRRLGVGRQGVIERDPRAVPQLENARGGHGLPRLEPVGDGDEVAAGQTEPHGRHHDLLDGFP